MSDLEHQDPRPLFRRAADQVEHQAGAVRPDELGNPTPCAEYDVRALLGHLVAVLRKLVHVADGGAAGDIPAVIADISDDDWVSALRHARNELDQVWADDAVLDRSLELPWATMSGRETLDAYTHELTMHSWDLGQATGRVRHLDPDLAEQALDWFTQFVPSGDRGEGGGFTAVVQVPDSADVYTRLAAYTGRQPGAVSPGEE